MEDSSADIKERSSSRASSSSSRLEGEKVLLFGRLSEVFDLPVHRLVEIFLESSDTEFETMKQSLVMPNGSRNPPDEESSSSSTDDTACRHCHTHLHSRHTQSQNQPGPGAGAAGTGTGAGAVPTPQGSSFSRSSLLLQYVRPSLPVPVPHDDPHREVYLQRLTDTLLYALSHRDLELVAQVVEQYPGVGAALKTDDLSTLLHSNPSIQTLRTLLNEGVDPNTFDKYGSTMLHKYVLDKDTDFLKLLLNFSADCNIEDLQNQRSAVQLAALQGDFEALYTMVTTSKIPVKVEKPDFDGNSLLHLVLQSEFPAVQYKVITMFLLDRGLSPAAKNLHGETPLHYFCVNQSLCGIPFIEPLFEMLLEALAEGGRASSMCSESSASSSSSRNGGGGRGGRGSCVDLRDDDDCTPLIIACAHREWELCKLLLLSGADMNIPCSMSSKLLTRGCDTTRRGLGGVTDFQADCTTGDLMPRSVRQKIFPHISAAQSLISLVSRDRCMNCAAQFADPASASIITGGIVSLFTAEPKVHCRNCGRVVCQECIVQSDLPFDQLPDYLKEASRSSGRSSGGDEASPSLAGGGDIRACVVCHPILSKDMKIAKFW